MIKNIWHYITELMNIRHDANIDGTIKNIKDGIEFKGTNVWILIASIIMASVGLNINAVGVIIGAMLIAPLMGPILGLGLSIGTNDFITLKSSIKAFGIMTIIALITSTLYFFLSPIKAETSELLGRTSPTFLDALVAFFGGLAGIVAGSRKDRSNVVPGVAIATALMPPLCTAGYGIAIGNLAYFMGAIYLFVLNSVLIAFATYLGVKYLQIPMVHLQDERRERKIKRLIGVFTIIILIPSAFILYNVTNESLFNTRVETYINEVIDYEGAEIISQKITYGDTNNIEIFTIGDRIPDKTINYWENQMVNYKIVSRFRVFQTSVETIDPNDLLEHTKTGIIKELYDKQLAQMKTKNDRIKVLEDEIFKLHSNSFPFKQISKEINLHYDINNIEFANSISLKDTIPTFLINWVGKSESNKLSEWLEIRLNKDSVRVLTY